MSTMVRVGARVINLEWVVAAENCGQVLEVFVFGLATPFRFNGREARDLWAAITAGARTPVEVSAGAAAPFTTQYTDVDEHAEGPADTATGIPESLAEVLISDLRLSSEPQVGSIAQR